jgi:hypothetical protein
METPFAGAGFRFRVVFFLFVVLTAIIPSAVQADLQQGRSWLAAQVTAGGGMSGASSLATGYQATSESAELWRVAEWSGGPVVDQLPSYLQTTDADASTENLTRLLFMGLVSGGGDSDLRDRLLRRKGEASGFGAFPGYQPDPLSTAFALAALRQYNITGEPAAQAIGFLLARQGEEGGWGLDGESAQVQTTALVMQSLWEFRRHYNLGDALTEARGFLRDRLAEEGEASARSNTETLALALIPLLNEAVDRSPYDAWVTELASRQNPAGDFQGDTYLTALALRALALSNQPPPDLTMLSGVIVDADSGQRLPDALITVQGPRASQTGSDNAGLFRFSDLQSGHYRIEIARSGYRTLVLNTVLETGDKRNLGEIRLDVRGTDPDTGEPVTTGLIRGQVTDRNSGAPLAGATVTLAGGASVTTGADGRYLLDDVTAGSVSVSASAQGYGQAQGQAEVVAGQTLVFSPALEPEPDGDVTVTGTVTAQESGEPIPGAMVTARVGDESKSATTDAEGAYRLDELNDGELTVTVSAGGFQSASGVAQAGAGADITFSPRLAEVGSPGDPQPGGFTGTVVDAVTGRGIEGARVLVEGDNQVEETLTDLDGGFRITGVAAGNVTLEVSMDSYLNLTGSGQVQAGFINDLGEIAITPQDEAVNSVTGRVVDVRTGDPLQGVLVQIGPPGSSVVNGEALSGQDGVFEVPGLLLADYEIRFSLEDYQDKAFPLVMVTGGNLDLGEIRMRHPGVDALLPDLAVQALDTSTLSSDQATFAATGALGVTLINRGNSDLTQPFTVTAFSDLDGSGTWDVDHEPVLGELPIAESVEVDTTLDIELNIEGDLPFRDAPITVMLDSWESVTELSESNNLESTAGECVNNQKPYLDLGLCMDSSGSVSGSDFQLQLEGTARAIEDADIVPRDGSVRVSVMQFASSAYVELDPVIIEEDNINEVGDAIRAINKRGGGTNIHRCIDRASDLITEATPAAPLRVIDVSTDGQSNQSLAVAASERAQQAGISVLNAIGVGSGANVNLLNHIVFPQPAGGERGFVLTVDGYEAYMEGIAGKISRETRIADLTVGALTLIDNGDGETVSFSVVLGNAGSADISEPVTLTFYNGDPSTAPVIGEMEYAGGLLSGGHHIAHLEGVDAALLTGENVRVRAEINGQVSECNTGNNTASETVSARLGTVTLTLSSTTLAPGEDLELDALVSNIGALPADYRVALSIEDSDGVTVMALPEQTVNQLAAGDGQRIVGLWNTGVTVTDAYRARAVLYGADGMTLDTDRVDFLIREGGDAAQPVADIRVFADQPAYRVGETVSLESLLENTSASTLIQGARYRLVVSGPDGVVLLNEERSVSNLAVAQVLPFNDSVSLDNTPTGTHSVTGILIGADGETLARDQATFTVDQDPLAAITGQATVAQESVFQGDSQTCRYSIELPEGAEPRTVTVTRSQLDIDNRETLDTETSSVVLSDQPLTFTDSFNTAGRSLTRHACALSVSRDGEARDLDQALFQIKEKPLSIEASLAATGAPRLLVLADPIQPTCEAVISLTLQADFDRSIGLFETVNAKAMESHYHIRDLESGIPRFFEGEIDNDGERSLDLAIRALDTTGIEIQVRGDDLAERFEDNKKLEVTVDYPDFLWFRDTLATGKRHFKCGKPPEPGDNLGDFRVVNVTLEERVPRSDTGGKAEQPAIADQRARLDTFLETHAHTLVDSTNSFRQQLYAGQHHQYLLLADRIPLDHWTAKYLREAVNRGEGVIHASGDRPRPLLLTTALGLKPGHGPGHKVHRPHTITLLDSALAQAGELPLLLRRPVPATRLHGADLAGYFKASTHHGRHGGYYHGGHPKDRNTPALTSHEYGDGQAVFLAFDWLAEMTALDLAGEGQGPMDGLMERALEHTAPASLSAVAGEPVPLRLMVENTGPALTVTVGLNWNNGGELLDVVPGMEGGHQWRFALEAGEARTLQAWIGSDPDDDSVLIEAVFEGEDPSGNQVTASKQLHLDLAQQTTSLAQVYQKVGTAYWQTPWDIALKKALLDLGSAKHASRKGKDDKALRFALKATSSLAASHHPDASALRLELDRAIRGIRP